jgi:hypothetical protein
MSLPLPSVILAAAPAVTASCPLPPVIASSGPAATTSAPLPAWIVEHEVDSAIVKLLTEDARAKGSSAAKPDAQISCSSGPMAFLSSAVCS